MDRQPPIAVVDFAAVTACGPTREDLAFALRNGVSGLRPADAFALPFATWVGAARCELPAPESDLACLQPRIARLLAHLLRGIDGTLARARRSFGDRRIGLAIGTSNAGMPETEVADARRRATGALPSHYDFTAQHAYDAILQAARALTGIRGPGVVVSTACSSGAKAFAVAQRWVQLGVVDAVVVGGVDPLCQMTLRGFHGLGVLSESACRPFGEGRDGISIGEGGALFVVQRSGHGVATVRAVGESSDAHHQSAPHPEGEGAALAMRRSLARAGLRAADIDHVNAHGTATALNDAAEAKAIAQVFGREVAVASTKGYTGHLLGAAGAVEAAIALLCLRDQFVPKSLGAAPLDATLDIAVATQGRPARLRTVASNSFAFGGNNACVIVGAP
ncbi:MAG: beta-ketoacyl-ACP synthase [Deltaproteobacteria bacterium]|nr:beta-ketoacyl-ACP synthase [Deltaproteobacteria bacterium]